jgi:hypothetical protein
MSTQFEREQQLLDVTRLYLTRTTQAEIRGNGKHSAAKIAKKQ